MSGSLFHAVPWEMFRSHPLLAVVTTIACSAAWTVASVGRTIRKALPQKSGDRLRLFQAWLDDRAARRGRRRAVRRRTPRAR